MEVGLLRGTGVAIILLAGCAAAGDRTEPATGVDPEMLRVTDMDGRAHDLGEGGVVALVFWSPWCEGCRKEAPHIAEAARTHGDRVRFYGVIPGPDEAVDEEEVRSTLQAFGYTFPQVRDRDLAMTRSFHIEGTPTVIVLGPGHAVRYKEHAPPADWTAFYEAPSGER